MTLPVEASPKIYRHEMGLSVEIGSTTIAVEIAKAPGIPWDQKLREDIETARASYRVAWGDVLTWDEFDRFPDTYNYIAFATYPSPDGDMVGEVLSNRLVVRRPEDLEFYALEGKPLIDAIPSRMGLIAGESRIGSIRPPHATSNTRTIEAFAAIKLQMVEDARFQGIDYIACQLRPEMTTKVLRVNGISYDFPPTEDVLGVPPGSIHLDRNNPAVVRHILRFPGYFLDTGGVFDVVEDVIKGGKLSEDEFKFRSGLDAVNALKNPRNVKEIVPLLDPETPVGLMLRARFLEEVPDGTFSSMSHVDVIERKALEILHEIARYDASVIR